MAPKKMPSQPKSSTSKSRVKKQKQPTQFTVQERVMVLGPSGKRRFEWRDR